MGSRGETPLPESKPTVAIQGVADGLGDGDGEGVVVDPPDDSPSVAFSGGAGGAVEGEGEGSAEGSGDGAALDGSVSLESWSFASVTGCELSFSC